MFGQVNSDEEWSDWSDDETSTVVNPFPEFTQKMEEILKDMKKKSVPKLNWSCPSDATWQMSDNSGTGITQKFLIKKLSTENYTRNLKLNARK